jgi:hypothetical protein
MSRSPLHVPRSRSPVHIVWNPWYPGRKDITNSCYVGCQKQKRVVVVVVGDDDVSDARGLPARVYKQKVPRSSAQPDSARGLAVTRQR